MRDDFNSFDKLRARQKYSELENEEFSRKPNNKRFYIMLIPILVAIVSGLVWFVTSGNRTKTVNTKSPIVNAAQSPTPSVSPIPSSKVLSNGGYHIFQSFNNCGPAALSMTLRFYGIHVSQEELGQALRPYQVPGGDNDDKSVTLEELAEKSKEYGFVPYHRPMGNPDVVKQFIANDIPVITRTWLTPAEDIGHYRVIKGYDEKAGTFLQDDSLQNKNLTYTYSDFNEIWKKFNYEYLVLVPKDKVELANSILGENTDYKRAWTNAVENSLKELEKIPGDKDARFNLSVAYYNIGEFQKSVDEFEKVENQLSFRTLWYQIEPIEAYFKLENYDRVMSISDKILNNQNRAFSELYVLRGKIYQARGQTDSARSEFQKAVQYNSNLIIAQESLNTIQ